VADIFQAHTEAIAHQANGARRLTPSRQGCPVCEMVPACAEMRRPKFEMLGMSHGVHQFPGLGCEGVITHQAVFGLGQCTLTSSGNILHWCQQWDDDEAESNDSM